MENGVLSTKKQFEHSSESYSKSSVSTFTASKRRNLFRAGNIEVITPGTAPLTAANFVEQVSNDIKNVSI